jgi:hypothetical protein
MRRQTALTAACTSLLNLSQCQKSEEARSSNLTIVKNVEQLLPGFQGCRRSAATRTSYISKRSIDQDVFFHSLDFAVGPSAGPNQIIRPDTII